MSKHGEKASPELPQVVICEMSVRDGMQIVNRDNRIPLDLRVRLVKALEDARLPYIEVGSFVSPKFMPAMRDTPDLLRAIPPYDGQMAALVPNSAYYGVMRQGEYDRDRLNTVALFLAVSEDYSQKNQKKSVREMLKEAQIVAKAALSDGYLLRAHLSTAFRDPETKLETPAEETLRVCRELLEMGCEYVTLADTDGRASPADLERVLAAFHSSIGLARVGVHLHDRYGFGIANALTAFKMGVRIFDSAIGGIGGNKVVENSVGNIATEELALLFDRMGVSTGLNLDAVRQALQIVHEMTKLAGDPPPSSKYFSDLVNTGVLHVEAASGRLRTYRDLDPDFERAIENFADAESELSDPVEGRVIGSVEAGIKTLLNG
jgi:hydroxymethylglutaryl-CoA lyase